MSQIFDIVYFRQATADDIALQREVADLFRGQVPLWRVRLAEAEPRARADAAHTIKGSARGMGFYILAIACEHAEVRGGADLEAIDGVLQALDDALAALDAWAGD
jgi:HPt (histidine-containing phosphotransfer) domain-containing protein